MSQTEPPAKNDPASGQPPVTANPVKAPKPAAQAVAVPLPATVVRPEQPGDTPHVNFWQTRLAQDVVPFATSVILHSIIIILALILVPKIAKNLGPDQHKEETIVPDVSLATDDNIGGVLHPGMGGDPTRDAAQENDPNQKVSQGLSQHKTDKFDLNDSAGGDTGSLIQRGVGSGPGRGTGGGADPFGGNGGEAAFGPRGGGGGYGPPSKLVGTGGNVKTVIFVCDGTGSMMWGNRRDILKNELKHEIGRMRPIQSFNIIFYQEKDESHAYLAFQSKLVSANLGNQSAVEDWLTKALFCADPDPRLALDEAFRESPQLIYFLTGGTFSFRGHGPSNDDMLKYFEQKNAEHKVHVNTVLFLQNLQNKEALDDVGTLLTTIAQKNGGTYKFFTADDF